MKAIKARKGDRIVTFSKQDRGDLRIALREWLARQDTDTPPLTLADAERRGTCRAVWRAIRLLA